MAFELKLSLAAGQSSAYTKDEPVVRECFDIGSFMRDATEVWKLFDAYREEMERFDPDFSKDHALEVRHRLKRMERMVGRIYQLQKELNAIPRGVKAVKKKGQIFWALNAEMEDLTEAYYYCAARTRTVLRETMPSMRRFECLGVREVRNHLIEHPEKHGAPILLASGWGGPNGPVVKPHTAGTSSFQDPGLFVNAREFIDNLASRLKTKA